jgi:hypothetical protein
MNILKKLSNFFTPPFPYNNPDLYPLTVKCNRCGETIRANINLNNDLSLEYNTDGSTYYICRKVLLGDQRCFQQVEIALKFSNEYRVLDRKISGGQFIDAK